MSSSSARLSSRVGPIAGIFLTFCFSAPNAAIAAAPKASSAEVVGRETELLRLTLTPEAERRLGLTVVSATAASSRNVRSVPGEVITAAAAGGLPIQSSIDLATLGANQARADGEVARLRAQLRVAESAFTRADELVKGGAGSIRAREEAEAVLATARANVRAADAQRALLGPGLTTLTGNSQLWVRAAAFASEISLVDREAPASVRGLGAGAASVSARPAKGPPSANPASGTIDLYFVLPESRSGLQFGQRVSVDLMLRGTMQGLTVPSSAIVRDIYGGEWVYAQIEPQKYERRRVEIASIQNGSALVVRGLSADAKVVSLGAMELFGAEFGAH